jgi:alpha-amylase/alpha-mannosidase (GH57 family)
MHQPYYEDLATREHVLPWVRLHATKDYWGMVALLREFPRVRMTFNLVPSLLVQIEAFAADRASDRHLAIGLKPADQLDAGERAFLVANGFHAPFDRMIRPSARYSELHARRSTPSAFMVDDLRDLQVLHKLVWMDPDWLANDPRLTKLSAKRRGYTEADKQTLREVELELLNAVIPAYRDAAASGNVELSTSPFYHPILPLLCDTDVHLRAHPQSLLPRQLFARSSDAVAQLQHAFDYHRTLFGAPPRGVWPSEGSVSNQVLEILAAQGCEWTATDEEILARSLGRALTPDDLYRPYAVGSAGRLRCLFRDHQLSDLIGFVYQSWDAEQAAGDFVAKVRRAGGEGGTVTVILDGENAWEHYPGGGRPFLRALYRKLQEATDIETVTMAEAASAAARPLASVFPGSWINGDFYIWAGHADDHRAWRQLAEARAVFDRLESSVAPAARAEAWQELLIAEGSDWFWWYGDDHSSDHDREFDDLFRRHLRNVYRALGQPAPDALHVSNISTSAASAGPIQFPGLLTPTVDGRADSFIEWAGSVEVPLGGAAGAMHRVAGQLVRQMRVACNRDTLFLQLTGPELVQRLAAADLKLSLLADRPRAIRVAVERDAPLGPRWSVDRVVEVAVPFAALGVEADNLVSFSVLLLDDGGQLIEQLPDDRPLELTAPGRDFDSTHWVV